MLVWGKAARHALCCTETCLSELIGLGADEWQTQHIHKLDSQMCLTLKALITYTELHLTPRQKRQEFFALCLQRGPSLVMALTFVRHSPHAISKSQFMDGRDIKPDRTHAL